MNNIKDNYTQGFPGVIKQMERFKKLVDKLDYELNVHLENAEVNYHEFGFKWILGLLIREFKLLSVSIIAIDYFLAYGERFDEFLIYVATAFLMKFSKRIKELGTGEIRILLRDLPTDKWGEEDIKMLFSEAYTYKECYKNSIQMDNESKS